MGLSYSAVCIVSLISLFTNTPVAIWRTYAMLSQLSHYLSPYHHPNAVTNTLPVSALTPREINYTPGHHLPNCSHSHQSIYHTTSTHNTLSLSVTSSLSQQFSIHISRWYPLSLSVTKAQLQTLLHFNNPKFRPQHPVTFCHKLSVTSCYFFLHTPYILYYYVTPTTNTLSQLSLSHFSISITSLTLSQTRGHFLSLLHLDFSIISISLSQSLCHFLSQEHHCTLFYTQITLNFSSHPLSLPVTFSYQLLNQTPLTITILLSLSDQPFPSQPKINTLFTPSLTNTSTKTLPLLSYPPSVYSTEDPCGLPAASWSFVPSCSSGSMLVFHPLVVFQWQTGLSSPRALPYIQLLCVFMPFCPVLSHSIPFRKSEVEYA